MKAFAVALLLGACQPACQPGPGGDTFYVAPNNPHADQAAEWAAERPGDAATMAAVAAQPTARWLSSNWILPPNVEPYVDEWVDAAAVTGSWPLIVVYDIPLRDCSGGWSAGGSLTVQAYMDFLDSVARGIGGRRAMVIVEPDALPDLSCLAPEKQGERLWMVEQAVLKLKTPQSRVYIDAGNPLWNCASCVAWRLNHAGIAQADGFSVNVNVYHDVPSITAYGHAIAAEVGGKPFVIDTGRAGIHQNEWCNPPGAALGPTPRFDPAPGIAAYLWVTPVGQSDGDCGRGEPPAGEWWAERALWLAKMGGF